MTSNLYGLLSIIVFFKPRVLFKYLLCRLVVAVQHVFNVSTPILLEVPIK